MAKNADLLDTVMLIQTKAENRTLCNLISRLIAIGDEARSDEDNTLLALLAAKVEQFEKANWPILPQFPQYPALFQLVPGVHEDENGAKIENPEPAGFLVTFPDFPGGITDAETEEEAMLMAGDALLGIIETYIENGLTLPEPGNYEGPQYRMITPKTYNQVQETSNHSGSSFDSFLEEEGIKAEVQAAAKARVKAEFEARLLHSEMSPLQFLQNIGAINLPEDVLHAVAKPGKRSGQACIRDLRITVKDVLEYLAGGMSEEQILEQFPDLQREDFAAVYAYAAQQLTSNP